MLDNLLASTRALEHSYSTLSSTRTFECWYPVGLPLVGAKYACTIYSKSKLKVMPLSLSVVYTRTFIFQLVGALKTSDFLCTHSLGLLMDLFYSSASNPITS